MANGEIELTKVDNEAWQCSRGYLISRIPRYSNVRQYLHAGNPSWRDSKTGALVLTSIWQARDLIARVAGGAELWEIFTAETQISKPYGEPE